MSLRNRSSVSNTLKMHIAYHLCSYFHLSVVFIDLERFSGEHGAVPYSLHPTTVQVKYFTQQEEFFGHIFHRLLTAAKAVAAALAMCNVFSTEETTHSFPFGATFAAYAHLIRIAITTKGNEQCTHRQRKFEIKQIRREFIIGWHFRQNFPIYISSFRGKIGAVANTHFATKAMVHMWAKRGATLKINMHEIEHFTKCQKFCHVLCINEKLAILTSAEQ